MEKNFRKCNVLNRIGETEIRISVSNQIASKFRKSPNLNDEMQTNFDIEQKVVVKIQKSKTRIKFMAFMRHFDCKLFANNSIRFKFVPGGKETGELENYIEKLCLECHLDFTWNHNHCTCIRNEGVKRVKCECIETKRMKMSKNTEQEKKNENELEHWVPI